MIITYKDQKFDCYYSDHGWSYKAIHIYPVGRWWLTRVLGLARLAVVPCTRKYGFKNTLRDSDFGLMPVAQFEEVCRVALDHYHKTLEAAATY